MRTLFLASLASAGATLLVLAGGLLLVSVAEDLWKASKAIRKPHDVRADSTAYVDREAARQVFRDQLGGEKEYRPFVEWRQRPLRLKTLTIDENGYRIHTAGAPRRGSASIGFFGGSTMWGVGASDNETIPAHFDIMTTGFTVANYGERGYTSRQSLDQLVSLINTRATPSVVVFYDGFNDIWVHCNYAVSHSLNGHQEEHRIRSLLARENQWALYRHLIQPFFTSLGNIKPKRVDPDKLGCSTDARRADAVAETLVRNWMMARELTTMWGGRFYAFLQPNLYVGSPAIQHLELRAKQTGRGEEFRTVYPIIRKKIDAYGLNYVFDLSDAFDGKGPIFVDDAHVTSTGNQIIAKRMMSAISRASGVDLSQGQ